MVLAQEQHGTEATSYSSNLGLLGNAEGTGNINHVQCIFSQLQWDEDDDDDDDDEDDETWD